MFGIKQNMKLDKNLTPKKVFSIKSNTRVKGFTLLEAVVTLLIAAIVAGLAVPSFNTVLMNSRINASTDKLYRMFNLARQEALASGMTAMVCRSRDELVNPDNPRCDTRNVTTWDRGVLAYRTNPSIILPAPNMRLGNHRINAPAFTSVTTVEERKALVLSSYDFPDNNVEFNANFDQKVIAFRGDGTLANSVNPVLPFRIAMCDDRGEENGSYIEINAVGKIFMRNTSVSGGVGCNALDN